ncbi:MAG TPA: hypothetical protein VKW78_14005 [Terriglobales bacterium]|nr:hypothetical protein [Terriglobales bacterium]
MSFKAVAWTLLAVFGFGAVLLFNYWAAYQPLSTLVYAGMVLTVAGIANVAVPFRLLGIRKRALGAFILAAGVGLTIAALSWPAPTIRVAQSGNRLDEIMPEYQFFEKHSARIHARPAQVLQAVRESKFGDLKSLSALMRVRAAAFRIPDEGGSFLDKPILDSFAASGYATGANEHEILVAGGANVRAGRPMEVRTLQEFVDYRQPGAVKIAFNFTTEDAGDGWSLVSTETRVLATDNLTRRGMGRYWRLIVPGSGLLRLQWLDAVKKRAESMPKTSSQVHVQ